MNGTEITAPNSPLFHDTRERATAATWLARASAPLWKSDLQVLAQRLGRSCGEVIELLDCDRANRAENELRRIRIEGEKW